MNTLTQKNLTFKLEWTTLRLHCLPPQPLSDYEVQDTAKFLDNAESKLPILAQVRRHTVELVDTVNSCSTTSMILSMVQGVSPHRAAIGRVALDRTDDFLDLFPR